MKPAASFLIFLSICMFSGIGIIAQNSDSLVIINDTDTLVKKDTWFRRMHEARVRQAIESKKKREERERQMYLSHRVHDTTRMNTLKTNPLLFIPGVNNIIYERKILKRLSVETQLAFISLADVPVKNNCSEYIIPYFQTDRKYLPAKGLSITIGPKLYVKKHIALSGHYFTVQYTYKYYKTVKYNYYDVCGGYREVEQIMSTSGIRFIWGNQIINKKNITFDIFWGFGVRFYNKTTNQYYKLKYEYIDECACDKELIIEDFEERKYNNYYISPTLHLGLNIGYTF